VYQDIFGYSRRDSLTSILLVFVTAGITHL